MRASATFALPHLEPATAFAPARAGLGRDSWPRGRGCGRVGGSRPPRGAVILVNAPCQTRGDHSDYGGLSDNQAGVNSRCG